MTKKKVEEVKDVAVVEPMSNTVTVADENPGIDLNEMEQGILLKRNSIGKYTSPEIAGLSKDEVLGRITHGKCVYVLWSDEEKDDEKGKLYFETDSREKAEEQFAQLCVSENLAEKGYTFKDVTERYHLVIVDVESGAPYLLDLSASSKKNFLNYSKAVRYNLVGNKNTNLSGVVTKIYAGEMKRGNFSWTAEFFEFVEDVK